MVPKHSDPSKVVNLMHTWPLWPHPGATSAESQMVPSSPISPRSPHATYCGDAAAVGQGRLGQALPGERSSLEVSGGPCHSNSGHPLDPLPTLPPFAHTKREAKKQGKEIAMNLLLATRKDPVPGVSLPVHSPQPSGRDR